MTLGLTCPSPRTRGIIVRFNAPAESLPARSSGAFITDIADFNRRPAPLDPHAHTSPDEVFSKDTKVQNIEVVARENYKRGDTSFSSQVANLRRAGADLVVLGTVPRETVGVMAEIAKTGWKVDALVNAGACAQATIALGKNAVEGLYIQCQYVPFDPANESAAVKDWMARYEARFKTKADVAAAIAYDMEDMVIIALDRAGRDLTAEKFIAGIESIKDYHDIFGTPPQTFGPDKHLGTEGFVLLRIEGGRFRRVVSFGG
jgi:ABC-type branched-subunit amino acid transport system substrate-binding protein